MIVARIRVNGTSARTVWAKPITRGMIGAQVRIDYAKGVWDGLRKTVVFRAVDTMKSISITKDVITDETMRIPADCPEMAGYISMVVRIPAECLEPIGYTLMVGVYGVSASGELVIPTLWATVGRVLNGTDPSGDTTTNPEPPVWAQILNIADEAKQLAQSVREDADAGVFDGQQGPRGDAYFASFEVDDNGHLQLLGADQTGNVSFALKENGNLEVCYA